MPVRIEPLEGPVGALVRGLDSRRPLGDEDFATVEIVGNTETTTH